MNFQTSKEIAKVLPAVIKTQKEIPAMGKDRKNPHAKSEYLTLDKINSIVLPIANENNILVSQLPVEKIDEDGGRGIGVDTILWHSSGEYILYPAVYYGFEKGGRMNNTQSVGSIITYAKRYAMTSIFGISTNEDDDGVGAGQQHGDNTQQVPQQPTEREKKWAEFDKHKQELFGRVQKLATESMQPAAKIDAAMLSRASKEMGEDQKKITPQNLAIYNKHLRAAEAKFGANKAAKEKTERAKEPEAKQGSFLKGNSTQIAEENTNE